eukprot:11074189-Alexandrium_andersonii.AAC.1
MASMGAEERWCPPDAATARSASVRRAPHQSPSTSRLKSPPMTVGRLPRAWRRRRSSVHRTPVKTPGRR